MFDLKEIDKKKGSKVSDEDAEEKNTLVVIC